MLAITLYEPYASLVACELKRFETRSWPAPFGSSGQRLAIHAARKWTPGQRQKTVELATAAGELVFPNHRETPAADWWRAVSIRNTFSSTWRPDTLGRVLCTVQFDGCAQIDDDTEAQWCKRLDARHPFHSQLAFRQFEVNAGDWSCGRYVWELSNVERFDDPPLARGRQRIWHWKPDAK